MRKNYSQSGCVLHKSMFALYITYRGGGSGILDLTGRQRWVWGYNKAGSKIFETV